MSPRTISTIKQLGIWTGVAMLIFSLNTLANYSLAYWFLPYNLLLAWIPLALAAAVVMARHRWQRVLALVWWLLFLPNAFYIITDYVHLYRFAPRVSYMFDGMMVGVFTVVAWAVGLLSLEIVMRSQLMRRIGYHRTLLIIVAALSGLAIYIGRVLRWNSWDILLNPLDLLRDLVYTLSLPGEMMLAVLTTTVFGVAILCCFALTRRVAARYFRR